MKKILGLDIGTNSIGWAFIESNAYENPEALNGKLIDLGSRIIPMDGDALSKFESGTPESKAAARRGARSARRLNQRYKLRRSRLVEALQILGWLPDDFPNEKREPNLFKKLDKHNINLYLPYSLELIKEAADFFEVTDKKTSKGDAYEISEDWIIYYLKTKALKKKVSLQELARILYHYNQRRGFKSSRKDAKVDDDEKKTQEEWTDYIFVEDVLVLNTGEGKDKDYTFYQINCRTSNDVFSAIKKRKTLPDWKNKTIEFRITKKTTKKGEVTYNIYDIDPTAWESRKAALEKEISHQDLSISEFYLNNLKRDRNYRIKQRIVDRSFYQKEIKAIWEKQLEYHVNIFSVQDKIDAIADSLYVHNKEKNKELKAKGLFHIFFNDIIYYQRGLKSQKGQLANCTYEFKTYKDKNGEVINSGVKVCNRSNPFFQEFRIWQTIHNLKIIKKEDLVNGKFKDNIDVSDVFLTNESKEKIFELFDTSKEISHDSILSNLGFKKDFIEDGEKTFSYKLNYPKENDFVGNETKALFFKVFKKNNALEQGVELLADKEKFYKLWHIIYSLPEEKDIVKALSNKKYFDLPENIIKAFSKLPEFKSQYASLSQRAITNLLPLMRVGKFWKEGNLYPKDRNTKGFNELPTINLQERARLISTTLLNSLPDNIQKEVQIRDFSILDELSGLPTFLAAYIAYGRHSERVSEVKYDGIEDFKIKELIPYNSLRNPVVEKVIRETLKLVKDVWADEKLGRPDYIHVELGRELKNNNKEREEITKTNNKNRVEKERIVALLTELKFPNFNPDSPSDIDKFRLLKEQGGEDGLDEFDKLFKGGKSELITNVEIEKYKLWAEQGYKSPYTGQPIPLSWLYANPKRVEVDHIIPKSKYYDDSFGNKVLVEAELNFEKGNRLAIQFIEEYQAKDAIELSDGSKRKVLDLDTYKKTIDDIFSNKKKRKHLKLYEVPEGFIERQMNDTKYISRTVAQFLRPVASGTEVIDDNGKKTIDEGVIYTSGSITSDLKNKWGLNKLWKELLKPRFQRLENIIGEKLITEDPKRGDYHFAKDYKRIDHRHHALDALVIACTTRSHIKYLNSLNSLSNSKKDISKYGEWEKWKYLLNKKKQFDGLTNGMTEFATPWGDDRSFYTEVLDKLKGVIVSHKPTSKLISKTKNKYFRWKLENGEWVKKIDFQIAPKDEEKYWVSVRQSLFGQPLGKIYLTEYKKDVDLKKAIKLQIEFIEKHKYQWNSEYWRVAKSILRKRLDGIIEKFNKDENSILKYLESNPLRNEKGDILEKIDLLCFKKYASKRVNIDETFTKDKINGLPYSEHEKNWLPNLLKEHLEANNDDSKVAFKGEGLEQLYKKAPFPINKVTRKEGGDKIELNNKLLDGDAGVNQFFLIETSKEFDKKNGEEKVVRKYSTPAFLDCIERLANGLQIHDENPNTQYLVLSPGDLVYVKELGEDTHVIDWNNNKVISGKVYIMKSSSGGQCFFVPFYISSAIIDTKECGANNKSERPWSQIGFDKDIMIKANCIKLKIDRLGKISPVQLSAN